MVGALGVNSPYHRDGLRLSIFASPLFFEVGSKIRLRA